MGWAIAAGHRCCWSTHLQLRLRCHFLAAQVTVNPIPNSRRPPSNQIHPCHHQSPCRCRLQIYVRNWRQGARLLFADEILATKAARRQLPSNVQLNRHIPTNNSGLLHAASVAGDKQWNAVWGWERRNKMVLLPASLACLPTLFTSDLTESANPCPSKLVVLSTTFNLVHPANIDSFAYTDDDSYIFNRSQFFNDSRCLV